MKTFKTIFTVLFCMALVSGLNAQDVKTDIKGNIAPYTIGVPYDRTVNLIFPYSIKSVDRGNSGVMVQKANGVENVLQLKAADQQFISTNLTVITGEGALYSFELRYDNNQHKVNYKVAEMALPVHQEVLFSPGTESEAAIQDYAKQIAVKQKSMAGLAHSRFDMALVINGIYIMGDVLYFQMNIANNSMVSYDTDQFRIYIRDKRKTKRTAFQETEITPIYMDGNISRIAGKSANTIVVAIDKFTIPDDKFLMVELIEKNGGRNLKIKLKNKQLIKAKGL